MEKALATFKKFLPILIGATLLGTIFGFLTLIFGSSYNPSTISIDFSKAIPIFWLVFFCAAIIVAFVFFFQIKSLPIKRIKKSSSFSKFSTLLAAGLVTALFFFNFIQFLMYEGWLSTPKAVRLIFSIPFIAYLIIGIIPKRIRHKKITVPTWLSYITAVGAVAWCISSLFAIYFWEGSAALSTTNFFRLTHMFYLALATVFFLSEIGFEMFGKGRRLYVLITSCLFVFTSTVTGSLMLAKFFGRVEEVIISEFELFVGVALGIYALSRLFAIKFTLGYAIKQQSNSHRHHHHHHHHHHHSNSKSKVTSTGKSKSDIPADIDI